MSRKRSESRSPTFLASSWPLRASSRASRSRFRMATSDVELMYARIAARGQVVGERHLAAHDRISSQASSGLPRAERIRAFVLRPCESTSGSSSDSAISSASSLRAIASSWRPVKNSGRASETASWARSASCSSAASTSKADSMYAIAFAMSPSCCQVSNPRRDRTRAAGCVSPMPSNPSIAASKCVRASGARRPKIAIWPARSWSSAARSGLSASSSACSKYRCALSFAPRVAARSPASDEHRLGVRPQLERIGCVGVELERRQQVRGDDLHELVVPLLPLLLQIRGGRNVPRLALLPRQCLVGDLAQEILEEAVLPALGRAGIRLEREDLLPHERHQQRVEVTVA